MSKDLTLKQKIFIEEYLKTHNACEAVRRAYPAITTDNAVRALSGKLMVEGGRVKMAIEERLSSVLGSKEEKLALAEKVISKLQRAFDECKVDKDMDKLGRTLLEVTGAIGSGNKVAIGINTVRCKECPYSNVTVFTGDMLKDLPLLPPQTS